jgi:hypothetical protein
MAATSGSTALSRATRSSSAVLPSSARIFRTRSSPSFSTAVAGFVSSHASYGAKRAQIVPHPSSVSDSAPPRTGRTISTANFRVASAYTGFRPSARGNVFPAPATASGNPATASVSPRNVVAASF